MQQQKIRRLTAVALCGAIAFILKYMSFSLPIISPFAEFDLSALPELIGGFILGPLGAISIVITKIALTLVFQGSKSMFTGELQNLILSLAYVLPVVLYYRTHRTKHGAKIALLLGSFISIIIAVFTNLYLIFPAFMALYGMNWDSIVQMCAAVNPWIQDVPTMVAFSIIPFNVISRAATSVIAFLVYKKISIPMKKLINQYDSRRTKHELQHG